MPTKDLASADYSEFLAELRTLIDSSRLSAARAVNRKLVGLYWDIGAAILEKQKAHGWGEAVVESLARDLSEAFPGNTGFSRVNLWGMRQLYVGYTAPRFLAQLVRAKDAPGPSHRTGGAR